MIWSRRRRVQRLVDEYLALARLQVERMRMERELGTITADTYVEWEKAFLARLNIPRNLL